MGVLAGTLRLRGRADAIVSTWVLRAATDGPIILVRASSLHVVEPAVAGKGDLDGVIRRDACVGPTDRGEEGVLLKLLLLPGEFALRGRGRILS